MKKSTFFFCELFTDNSNNFQRLKSHFWYFIIPEFLQIAPITLTYFLLFLLFKIERH